MVYDANVVRGIEAAEINRELFHLIAHESSHVHDLKARDEAFPNVLMQTRYSNPWRNVLGSTAAACWDEYAASYFSAQFSVDETTDNLAELFSASLNKYIAAEMPALSEIPEADRQLVADLTHGQQVNRVGLLFERLLTLFDAGAGGGLVDSDFDGARVDSQGHDKEWGGTDHGAIAFDPLVRPVKGLAEARALLAEIAKQGEGHQAGPIASHFQRFLSIYKKLEQFKESKSIFIACRLTRRPNCRGRAFRPS
ncbi:ferritin-like protein [Bradyrhizobium cenepequi]|uniref:ferritin-like protein n=1 Tax=Bradyrhizobium cenepequi TaxID=2821403 RepID=UPI001CE368DE|nr:ferritin-like protein [Bradyrhizobium cenepequi]MCA6112193.1 hypothetical protein [Bradyrhizobium cenepequi]